jgi:hypothetical protein
VGREREKERKREREKEKDRGKSDISPVLSVRDEKRDREEDGE